MSSTQHTAGPLVVGDDSKWGGDPVFIESDFTYGKVATLYVADARDLPKSEANARRLVACWNFCEGVETDAIEGAAVNLATLFEGMKAGADSVTAWRQRAQQAVDALAQVETYLQARVDPNGPSTAATKILPMIRKAIEGAGVAPTQTSWGDC